MPSDSSPRLNLPFVQAAQAQKHVTVNENLLRLDSIIHLTVQSLSVVQPPDTPSEQEAYILPAGYDSVQWENGEAGAVMIYREGIWEPVKVAQGFVCFVVDEKTLYVYDGTEWVAQRSGTGSSDEVGINTSADATNRLSVKSDAVLFSHDDVTPGSGDMRVSLNKAQSTRVGSLLFQTAYSTRAEIGLIENDNPVLKVSTDGINFKTAIHIDAESGACDLAHTVMTDRKVKVFSPGTYSYSPPEGVKALSMTIIGGGGGGAGARTTTAIEFVGAGGGGAGGVSQISIPYSDIEPSYELVVGEKGRGGFAIASAEVGSRSGSAGGKSEVRSASLSVKAGGGLGASEDMASIGATAFAGGEGGHASGGTLNFLGQKGGSGVTIGTDRFQGGVGLGGTTIMGQGGPCQNGNGLSGSGYGSGGSGCGMIPRFILNRRGGDGGPGAIIIEEFYG